MIDFSSGYVELQETVAELREENELLKMTLLRKEGDILI